jgi:hypothetical protein
MKKGFPPVVGGGPAKALGVILQLIPLDEQQVVVGLFMAAGESKSLETSAFRNDVPRAFKSGLEGCRLACFDG